MSSEIWDWAAAAIRSERLWEARRESGRHSVVRVQIIEIIVGVTGLGARRHRGPRHTLSYRLATTLFCEKGLL